MDRLKEKYIKEVAPILKKELGAQSIMAVPLLVKMVVNVGIKEGASDQAALTRTAAWLSTITGQLPSTRAAKQSIATFKIREGDPIGLTVTLRGTRMYGFLDRLISIVLPRVRDFRGVPVTSFDGHGNYTLGLAEQIVFPEVDYSKIDRVRGLEVTIVTNTKDDKMAYRLLQLLGMPFRK